MDIIFVDWTPTYRKSDIRSGITIRRYYAWATLNEMFDNVMPFRNRKGYINWKTVIKMFDNDAKMWVEYGCGGAAHFFVLLASLIRPKQIIILNVHDFVRQQNDIDEPHTFLKGMRLKIVEQLLFKRANTIILPGPGVLDYFKQKKNQKVLIMAPGVGGDELFVPPLQNRAKKIKIAMYFGSMRRKGAIPKIIDLFSELKDWELHLVGPKENEEIVENENVTYLGSVRHDELADILSNADAVLIPFPKNDYLDKAMFIKTGYALKSCKPVIATMLEGTSEYVSMVGLEENVIYVEEWNRDSLEDALQKAQNLNIDAEKTIEKLRPMAWEPRFRKAIEIAMDANHRNHFEIEWI